MNLRQKNKKLKRELELSKQRVEYLEIALSACSRFEVAKEPLQIDTLKVFQTDLADRIYQPIGYERLVADTLIKKLARGLVKYVDMKKVTNHGDKYPMDVYEATVRVVRPERNLYGLTAEILMVDENHGQK